MTLDKAHELLQAMGHTQTVRHDDHLCSDDDPHYLEDCPLAPHFAFTEGDLEPVDTERELSHLLATKLREMPESVA